MIGPWLSIRTSLPDKHWRQQGKRDFPELQEARAMLDKL